MIFRSPSVPLLQSFGKYFSIIQESLKVMSDFIKAKRAVLNKYFERMNDMQREAVFSVNGPVLILAGAGSGKKRMF